MNHRIYIPNFRDFIAHKSLRILILSNPQNIGEGASSRRMVDAFAKLGYSAAVIFSTLKPIYARCMDIDFVISSQPEVAIDQKFFNFLILHCINHNVTKRYDSILSVIPPEILQRENKARNLPVCPFYFSACRTDFYNAPKKKLFFCGDIWDDYRKKYCVKTYELLDQTGYFEVYGPLRKWRKLKLKSYGGFISNEDEALLHTMQKAGVSLVLHSDDHFNNNIVTARTFEALAASNVIICDRLPFIVENFGDTVLYVDRNVSPEELFKQIDNHMQWILSHQKEAIDLAKKSHKIFIEKFSLEMILRGVIDFYLQQKNKKTEKKLTNS